MRYWRSNSIGSHQQNCEWGLSKNVPASFILGALKNLPTAKLPYQKVSEAQMQERRKK